MGQEPQQYCAAQNVYQVALERLEREGNEEAVTLALAIVRLRHPCFEECTRCFACHCPLRQAAYDGRYGQVEADDGTADPYETAADKYRRLRQRHKPER
jgi:hypothetical protein